MAAAGVAATEHVLRSTLRADQIITYDAAKAMTPAEQAVCVRYFVCKPCTGTRASTASDSCIRVRDAFYGRGGKAARLYSRCAKQLQNVAALDAAASTKKREETAVTNERGTPLLDLVRMHDDLMQQGLLKKDKKAASFVTIGEPDIKLHAKKDTATVEIEGGATLTLHGDGQNGHMITNFSKLVVPDVAPAPKPFNGQFIQLDVVEVTEVK
jgi:hypothetical protein